MPSSTENTFCAAIRVENNANFRGVRLKNYLQRQLNVPGFCRQRLLQPAPAARRSVRIEYLGITGAEKGQGRRKVGVIQDVEKLRPELHTEALRNLRYGEVLMRREIDVVQIRADNTVAAGITQQIRATARNLGKRHALRCDSR
jgi:hypothetical protein